MRIPRFWAAAEGSGTSPDGRRLFHRLWGWSMSSTAEAVAVAQDRVRSALARARLGRGPGGYYPRTPLREPILDELLIDGEQYLVVTRNRYGAEVLNTDRVLIADVDLPELEPTGGGPLRRLFHRSADVADPFAEPPLVVARLGMIESWARAHPDLGVIVYRTASGLRVFVTGMDDPASSAHGQQILAELAADPVYRELCRAHGTFRARLTPKPWRLPRMTSPRDRWPVADARAERRVERWLADYEAAARPYAVCRRLASDGQQPSTMEAAIIRLHDDRTRVTSPLPLA